MSDRSCTIHPFEDLGGVPDGICLKCEQWAPKLFGILDPEGMYFAVSGGEGEAGLCKKCADVVALLLTRGLRRYEKSLGSFTWPKGDMPV